ncbi:MAG: hypothetical protein IKB16_15415 [Lentisphaeria bacterium]|nr:hypothetical protein [Lentisphaeria bacterium]
MMKRTKLHFAAVALTCLAFAVPADLPAQSSGSARDAKLSKRYWDLWRTGFESYEAGESALLAGRNEEAADCYRRALKAFQSVKKNNPNWNKNVINYRISLADRRMKTALRRLEFQNSGAAKNAAAAVQQDATKELKEKIKALQDSLAESERINLDLRKLAEQGKVARDQVVDLLKEKKEIEKKYEALVLQYNEMKKTADHASADTSSLEKAFKKEQARSEALLKIVDDLRKESKEWQAKLQKTQNKLEAEKQKLSATNRELASAQKSGELLEELQKKYKRMEKDLNEKLDVLKEELKAANRKIAAKTEENEALQKGQTAATKKLSAETEQLRDQADALRKDIAALKNEIKAKDKQLYDASNREMRLNSMVVSLNDKNKKNELQLKTTEKTLTAEQDKVRQTEQRLSVLTAENKDLKEKVKLLAEKVNKIPVVTAAAEGEKLKAQQDLKQLNSIIAARNAELDSVKKELAAAQKALAEAEKTNAAQKQKIAALEKAIAELKKNTGTQDANAKQQIVAMETAMANLKKEAAAKDEASKRRIAELEMALANLKKEAATKDEAAKVRIAQLEKGLDDFKKASTGKDEASKLNIQLRDQLDKLQKELADQKVAAANEASDLNKKMQNQLDQLRKEMTAQKVAAVNAEQKKAAGLQAEINRLTARVKTLTDELNKVKTAQAGVTTQLTALKSSSGDLRQAIQTVTAEKNALAEQNKKLSKELLNTQALLEKIRLQAQDDTKLRAAEKARDGWKEKTEIANKKNQELAKNIQEQKAALKKAKAATAAMEKKRDELMKKLQRTESELEGWKKNQNMVSKNELEKQIRATDTIANELKAKIAEINKLKAKLMESDALATRYRQNLQIARDVTEKAMAESRKLRADLAMYRRNDPHAMPEVEKAKGMPKEILTLTTVPNAKEDRARKADVKKFDSLMAKGKQLENQKKYDDALWQYWAAADAGVNRPEPYMAISRIHAIRNNPEQGIKTYERALRLGGKRVPAIEQTLKKQLIDKKKKAK